MAMHLTPALFEFCARWLPPVPAAILDVGCGAGESTERLRELGYSVVGVDPTAPTVAGFVRSTLEDLRVEDAFDAALAVRSLHHVRDLGAAVSSLHAALRENATLVVNEFVFEALGDATEKWSLEHDLKPPIDPGSAVLRFEEVDAALAAKFEPLEREPTGYLALEAGRPELEGSELEAIAAGTLPAVGIRAAYRAI
jgi:SAM-dependent methyltransferase